MPRSWQQVAGRQGDVERFWVGVNSLAPHQTGMGGPKIVQRGSAHATVRVLLTLCVAALLLPFGTTFDDF